MKIIVAAGFLSIASIGCGSDDTAFGHVGVEADGGVLYQNNCGACSVGDQDAGWGPCGDIAPYCKEGWWKVWVSSGPASPSSDCVMYAKVESGPVEWCCKTPPSQCPIGVPR